MVIFVARFPLLHWLLWSPSYYACLRFKAYRWFSVCRVNVVNLRSSSSFLRSWLQEWARSISLCGHFLSCYIFLLSQRKFRLRRSPQCVFVCDRSPQCVFVCERRIFLNTGTCFSKCWLLWHGRAPQASSPKDNKMEYIHANFWGESDISNAQPENKAWQHMVENM